MTTTVPSGMPRNPVTWLRKAHKVNLLSTVILPALFTVLFIVNITTQFAWWKIAIFIVWWFLLNVGIGVGNHRAWSHRAAKLHPIVECPLAILAAATISGSSLKWCSDHMHHHQDTDGEMDPHNAQRGFWWAHIGWILFEPTNGKPMNNVVRLARKKALLFQHRYYWQLAVLTNIVPALIVGIIAGSWGVGFSALFAFQAARALQLHGMFCVNSVCHTWGKQRYQHDNTYDNWLVRVLTNGEGGHNFHHAFARDYRNSEHWFQWDPHAWILKGLSTIGLATELFETPSANITETRGNFASAT